MKKIITAAVLLLATALSAFSQTKNITVSGRVLEDTNEPAVQATIQLLSLPDSRCCHYGKRLLYPAEGECGEICAESFLYRF